MQFLVDLLPIIAFFAAYKLKGIYVATAVMIAATLIVVLISWIRHRTVSKLLLGAAAVAVLLGGMTLYLRDPTFIKWKLTAWNCTVAAVLLVSEFMRGPNLTERLFSQMARLPKRDWTVLNTASIAFLVLTGALNLYVAYNYPEGTWVNFKVFGLLPLTFVFMMIQVVWIVRRGEPVEQETT